MFGILKKFFSTPPMKHRQDVASIYQQAIANNPSDAEAWVNLGNILKEQGQLKDAEHALNQATLINPNIALEYYNFGNILLQQTKLDEALVCFQNAILITPDFAEAYGSIGTVLMKQGQPIEALYYYQKAIIFKPDFAELYVNAGNILKELGRLNDSISSYKKALVLRQDFDVAHNNLGFALTIIGKTDDAISSYRQALMHNPDNAVRYSNLLLTIQYSSTLTPAEKHAEHQRFAERFEAPLKQHWQHHTNTHDPHKRLKIGYISADFHGHSVAYFIEPILAKHNKSQVELFCYYNNFTNDSFTERMKLMADHWVPCVGLSDDQLADQVRADGIDILIDLAGHTAHNRLLAFARKPAPIQATYIGYPTTTGITAIDYRITDEYVDPAEVSGQYDVEQLWRLPEIYCCYRAHDDSPEVIDHPPVEDNGYITFGCFNNYAKLTDEVIAVWARLLERVPSSRLMLKINGIDSAHFRTEVEKRFSLFGIPIEHLILIGYQKDNPFALYNKIDIALDPFPYNGCTTSFDALWMGVPLVTLAGASSLSRVGVSILSNAGLPGLIAFTEEQYIEITTSLALDLSRLKAMRTGLRERVQQSPLMNAQRLTLHLEQAYREMWQKWCISGSNAKSYLPANTVLKSTHV